MSGCCLINSLRRTLQSDRAAHRNATNRKIRAEADLLRMLSEWQAEGDPDIRQHWRALARRQAKTVKRVRSSFKSTAAALSSSNAEFQAARGDTHQTEAHDAAG